MKTSNCDNCEECVYIGEGDYACLRRNPPKIVKEDFSIPTDDYMWCKRKEK